MTQRASLPVTPPKSQDQQDTDFTSEGAPPPPAPARIPVKGRKTTKAVSSSPSPPDPGGNPPWSSNR